MSVRILTGDCRTMLARLVSGSVNCCVTSPPYFGLRDYGVDGQMGLEATPDEFVTGMVAVFREVRRVLRDDGTLWLNIGDSYGTKGGDTFSGFNERYSGTGIDGGKQAATGNSAKSAGEKAGKTGLPPKSLIGVPWRLAFALQADGWILRQDIIWSKPNPMPESVRDRCTKAHEYLFLLSKGPRYYFDQEAILEAGADASIARLKQNIPDQAGSERVPGKTNGAMKAVRRPVAQHKQAALGQNVGGSLGSNDEPLWRNKRSVWTVATQPFSEAHFATLPPELIEPCILAGCPKGGMVLDPFFGAGTTGLVADRLQRDCIGIELNPAYVEIAERRLAKDGGMFAEIEAAA
jgi:DNA modification methylase